MASANEDDKAKRRDWLCSSLLFDNRRESFDWLIAQLGCSNDFEKFEEQFFALFSAVAYISMTYSDKTIIRPHMTKVNLTWLERDLNNSTSTGSVREQHDQLNKNTLSERIGKANKSLLVEYFGDLFNMVTLAIHSLSENGQWFRNILQYEGSEHQNNPIAGGKHKIDFAIHYTEYCEKNLSSVHIPVEVKAESQNDNILQADFGQMADYGRALWNDFWFRHQGNAIDGRRVSVETNAKTLSNSNAEVVNISSDKKIERSIKPRGRLAHIYRTTYCGKAAVLKISWTPTNRLPECAVYDVLADANIECSPEVFDSGIICDNSIGYRVEFLIIQDCGIPLADYINHMSSSSIEDRCEIAAKAMLDVAKCLKKAWDYGILHRDISAGNITVLEGRATVIDWGHAKLLSDRLTNIDDLAAKWCFKKDQVIYNEDAHDPLTGTPLYMSIPILVGSKIRSVVDDIESALYVVLDSVYKAQDNISTQDPIALDYTDRRSLAFIRACSFSLTDQSLLNFGIQRCSDRFVWLVSAVRKFIFVRSNVYIGNHLAMIPGFERTVEDDALEDLLNEMEQRLSNETNKHLLVEPTDNTAKGLKQVELSNLNLETPQPRRSKRRINVAGKYSARPVSASSDASGN
ncbi:hypothetical protein H4S08_003291 [Coemansia sp. RSA 1365]|nr:hypothetical protein H4S08_003291 [Coemansia sp. RSA 1365]